MTWPADDVEGTTQTGVGLGVIPRRPREQEFSLEPIQLCLPPAITRAVHDCQRLSQAGQTLSSLACLPHISASMPKKCGSATPPTIAWVGCQALVHLGHALCHLTLHRDRPALKYSTHGFQVRKRVLLRKSEDSRGLSERVLRMAA